MPRLLALYQWNDIVGKRFPHLSKPMAACLALWSLGMIVARSCSLTAVAWAWVPILKEKFYTLRERLRDLYREAPAKAGCQRSELDLSTCWAPWLAWVIQGWHSKQLALALDATTLGDRFSVLAISVVYRGCAVPVAWKIMKATEPHAWAPEWKTLLSHFRERVPDGWNVIVLADRGIYAKWLFEAIASLHWHPLLRVADRGKFQPEGWCRWIRMKDVVTRLGQRWQGRGIAFKHKPAQLRCTLLACWEEGYGGPWIVLTNLPPEAADVCWYGLRAWIEQGFKRIKRGGWQWQYTRMADPVRAERVWLAVAIATWWLLSVGGEADEELPVETMDKVPHTERSRKPRWRLIAVFHRGWIQIIAALMDHEALPLGEGWPEPWPNMLPPRVTDGENDGAKPKNLQL